jgi:hypothetical protein
MRTHRFLLPLAAALLASCGDYGASDQVTYGEAVFTQPRPGYDYRPLTEYWIDPNYKEVQDDASTVQPLPSAVVAAIKANMDRLGYVQLTDPGPLPPLGANRVGIHISVLKGTRAVYYPGYWCDYWYWYYCYYDWYYAGSYRTGTVIMEMADLSAAVPPSPDTPGQGVPILWLGAVYGILQGAGFDAQRAVDGINRAYDQSPYLDTH